MLLRRSDFSYSNAAARSPFVAVLTGGKTEPRAECSFAWDAGTPFHQKSSDWRNLSLTVSSRMNF
jgi:hypothetical protein